MDAVTRREAVGVALAGAVALAAADAAGQQAAGEDEKAKRQGTDDAERKRVIACGLSEAEAECWLQTSRAAAAFFALPELHPMDGHEVAHAIHVVQQKLLSRPAYRQYKELAAKEQPK